MQPITNAKRSHFLTARAAARHMVRRGSGVILAFGGNGPQTLPGLGGFKVALDAIEGLRRQWACELGQHGIRVVTLKTGGVPESIPDTFALVPVFLFFRRRIITLGKKKPLRTPSVTPTAVVSHPPSASLGMNTQRLLEDISSTNDSDIREAIILRYHQLIPMLSGTGVRFSPSFTDRDIKNTLIQHGFSKDATEAITDLFELAQYSPYQLGAKEAVMFNANLHALMETLGGYSWIQR